MDEANIKRVILKYRELIPENILKRDLEIFKTGLDKANVIIGPRRSGKTFFLYSLVKKSKKPVLINFEDSMVRDIGNLNKIADDSKELFGKESLTFFFDEMQAVTGWERFVISLLNEHYPVYITGSNSKLLSKEIATSLRGKSLPYLLLPFSFLEFLRIKGIHWEKNSEHSDIIFKVKKYFKEYMQMGGFPEIILTDSVPLKNKLVNNYFDSVLYKDLVERLEIKNIKLIEITMKYLLNLFGNIFSISAYENFLKSNKVKYSLEDLYNILRSLEDVFFAGFVKGHSKSFKKTEISKSRVYLFDTSYIHFLSNEPNDYGRILENLVFIELFRRQGNVENKNIFYYKLNGHECDFVVTKRDKVSELIQVTYELTSANRKREVGSLITAMDHYKQRKGVILTYGQEDKIISGKKKIVVMPVWKWMVMDF